MIALICRCFGQDPPSASGVSARQLTELPSPGTTLVPPLNSDALKNQAAFSVRICRALGRTAYETRAYTDPKVRREPLRYRLFKPSQLAATNALPLVVCLHGGGATQDFEQLLKCASPVFSFGPARFVSAGEQERHPAFVLVPWSGMDGWDENNLHLIAELIGSLRLEFLIDPKRLYVTGQSMGGFGTWRMIEKYSELFAAAIPVCGGGDPALARNAKKVAIWAFHGSKDGIVPVVETRRMIAALERAGGTPIYWEYQGATHADTTERAYCEPRLLDWLFAQASP
jgi:predicted peptidase